MKNWFMWLLLPFCFVANGMANPLPAKDVFQLTVNVMDSNTMDLNWSIKPGYFLYSDRISISSTNDKDVTIAPIALPATVDKTDHEGRVFKVYRNQISLQISVLGEHPGESLIMVHYQGCSDEGFCYPPEDKQIKLTINDKLELSAVEPYAGTTELKPIKIIGNNNDKINTLFATRTPWMIILTFFGFGLLLSLTPCILPMIPILSGIILGQGHSLTTRKAFALSLSYVLSMALTYAIIGAVIAKLGSNLQIIMQTPVAISVFSILFILLAFSMFGYYDIKLPVSWQNKLARANRSQAGGHYLGAAIMGSLSILILSPCVTPPLIGVLSYIAQNGNVIMGSVCLFVLGLGMGVPLLLIGTSAGRFLPKAGHWMNAVKGFFGVILLAMAILLLARIIPVFYPMLLWSSLLIFCGISVGVVRSKANENALQQTLGVLLLCYGLLILIGASMGSNNPLQPLKTNFSYNNTASGTEEKITSANQLNTLLQQTQGKMVLLDFYADWCNSCKIMEATVFQEPEVISALAPFKLIKVDITQSTPEVEQLLQDYSVVAPPTYIFLNKKGLEIKDRRIIGEVGRKELLKTLSTLND